MNFIKNCLLARFMSFRSIAVLAILCAVHPSGYSSAEPFPDNRGSETDGEGEGTPLEELVPLCCWSMDSNSVLPWPSNVFNYQRGEGQLLLDPATGDVVVQVAYGLGGLS